MKVLVWTDSDCFAGTERHCLDLAVGLKALGVDVWLGTRAVCPLAEKARNSGIDVLEIGGTISWVESIRAMVDSLRHGKLDVIHTHNGVTTFWAAVAIGCAGRGKLVSTQHFITPARESRRGLVRLLSDWMHCWLRAQLSCCVAISKAVALEMSRREAGGLGDVAVVWNGVAGPGEDEPTREVARRWIGNESVVPLILCPARLEPEKGHAVLLEALRLMRLRGNVFEAVFVGGGSLEDALRAKIARFGLGDCVRLVGHQERPEVWMRASDIVVLPSPAEPFGLVLVEAMSRGVPVVAAAAGGPLEIVDQESGMLFSPGNSEELASMLGKLLADSGLRRRLGLGGQRRWRKCFSVPRMAEELLAVYRKVAEVGSHAVEATGSGEILSTGGTAARTVATQGAR